MSSLQRWVGSQRIGIASYLLDILHASDSLVEPTRELLGGYLDEAGQGITKAYLLTLPVSVLEMLATAARHERKVGPTIARLCSDADNVRRELHEGTDAPIWQAQVWAYYALMGRSSPLRLLRLGRTLFDNDRNWRQAERDARVVEKLDSTLKVLRQPWSRTEDRVAAVEGMASFLKDARHWAQIENTILHHLFYWPLLVLADEGEETANVGISFPVAIDTEIPAHVEEFDDGSFADSAFERIKHRRYVEIRGQSGTISLDKWISHLELATRAAKKLWRAKHGNHGDFRSRVKRARIAFDFSVAQAIASDLGQIGLGEISIADGSADAYFAQAVLNKLRGGPGILASAVTGLIGEQLIHEDGTPALNHTLVPPGGIAEKLAYAFASRNFERVVVPAGSEHEVEGALASPSATSEEYAPNGQGGIARTAQTAEVNYAHDLHDLADIVQVGGWRQYQYVRCSEVAWAIHTVRDGRPGLIPADDARVEQVIRFLATNGSQVASLEAPATVVASALWHINTELRLRIRPYPPPSLSWAVIRTVDGEQDARFWKVLWRLLGAPEDEFFALLHHPSKEEAVRRLASALNRFEPDLESPGHRAPDIVIIVGSRRFNESQAQTLNPGSRPFMVAPILQDIGPHLQGPFDERFLQLVGRSRILLLPEVAVQAEVRKDEPNGLTSKATSLLSALATFQWGFSQQTASLLLSEFRVSGVALRRLLRALVEAGALRYGQGTYHIPAEVREAIQSEENPRVLATRHYAAGCAIAPFVTGTSFPALALDVAFYPDNLHEAERHFALAFRHAQVAADRTLRNRSQVAMQRLERFAELPGWGTVDRLLKSQHLGRDAYEMAAELLGFQESARVTSHPCHWVFAARAAAQWVKSFRGPDGAERAHELRRKANECFGRALEACSKFPAEDRFNRLHVLTNYIMYIVEHEPERQSDIGRYKEQALSLLLDGVDGQAVFAEWFEWLSDAEDEHSKASSLYKLGWQWKPQWAQLWVKGLGAASLARRVADVKEIREALSSAQAASILSKAAPGYRKHSQRATKVEAIEARWQEGFRRFEEFWGVRSSTPGTDKKARA